MTDKQKKDQKPHQQNPKTEAVQKQEEVKAEATASATAELEKFKDLYMRTLADFENFKRRNSMAVQSAVLEGVFTAVQAMLPSFDAISKAVSITEGDVQKGLNAVLNNILESFKQLGIEPIEAENKEFNPNVHNAVTAVECKGKAGIVIEEFQKGFKMGDKVLRYSMVSVGK